MLPLVIEYLKTHTFAQLKEEHGIAVRPSVMGDKFSLNYDQIMSKPNNPVSNQCRGLIIRPVGDLSALEHDWENKVVGDVVILAWPMSRFFNLGDSNAAEVDWNDPQLRVYDKLDGTCCIVYWDDKWSRWNIATRSVPEADLPIKKDHIVIGNSTFSDLFTDTFVRTWHTISPLSDVNPFLWLKKEWTYVFELTSPYNKIVVKYDEPEITLLAIRDLITGREIDVSDETSGLSWVKRAKSWPISEPTGLIAFLDLQDPSKVEGAVVCDSRFNRVKIKSKAYLLSFKMKDMLQLSRRSVLEAVLEGRIDDVIPHLEPDLAEHVRDLQDRVRKYFATIDTNFRVWKNQSNGDRKAFAVLVQQSEDWHVPYYAMLKNNFESTAAWAEDAVKAGRLSQTTLEYLVSKLRWNPAVE